jgi:hypothetical protein
MVTMLSRMKSRVAQPKIMEEVVRRMVRVSGVFGENGEDGRGGGGWGGGEIVGFGIAGFVGRGV